MKTKLLYLLILAFSLVYGCSQINFDGDFSAEKQSKKEKSNVNFNVGLTTAEAFVDILNKDENGELRKEVKAITPIIHGGDTLLYLVNYKDDKGWIVISGDKRTSGILAYADNGLFETESLNQGQMTWLDDLANQIYILREQSDLKSDTLTSDFNLWNKIETYVTNTNNYQDLRSIGVPINPPPLNLDTTQGYWLLIGVSSQELSPTQVGPLVQTKWGQSFPWNTCVPYNANTGGNCATGCVAVAGAQMLYYLHHLWNVPATMYSTGYCNGWVMSSSSYDYSFSFGNRTATMWNDMATEMPFSFDYNSFTLVPISNAATDKVAILMGYIGWQVGMSYGEQSSAPFENLVGLYYNEGINSSCIDFNSSAIVPNLNNNLPVIISASATQNNHTFLGLFHLYYTYDDGHAWIIDGYQNKNIKYTYEYQWYPNVVTNPPSVFPCYTKTEEEIVTTPNYFSMNWGWDGTDDYGWYSMGNSAVWTVYDEDGNPLNFQYKKKMITNFSKK